MSLLECLSKIEDPRRAEGLRYSLLQMFSMLILSGLCGHFGGRPVRRFTHANGEIFIKELALKHPIPSHVSFSTFLNSIPKEDLIRVFHAWTASFVPLEKGTDISGDGKALRSTNLDKKGEDFDSIVSFFCQESGLIHSIAEYRNAKKGEGEIVRLLLIRLKDMGLTLHLDALHCQKKQ